MGPSTTKGECQKKAWIMLLGIVCVFIGLWFPLHCLYHTIWAGRCMCRKVHRLALAYALKFCCMSSPSLFSFVKHFLGRKSGVVVGFATVPHSMLGGDAPDYAPVSTP